MRIRKSASRLLGSAYFASASAAPPVDAAPPPFDLLPPPHPAPCSAPESCGGLGFSSPSAERCELSRSPWDLIADLSLSDQKVEDELVEKYFVHVTTRASWLFSATMPATSAQKKKKLPAACKDSTRLRREVMKKAAMDKEKKGEAKKKVMVKKEEGQDGGARVWMCKKNDGRRWHCNRPVSQPNTYCEYHFVQKRSYLNPDFESPSMAELVEAAPVSVPVPVPAAASKSSTRNRPRKKKLGSDLSVTEGFYYYAGFGPFRTKRQCRSGGMNKPLPAKQEEEGTSEDASDPTEAAAEVAEFASHPTEAAAEVAEFASHPTEAAAEVAEFANQAASQDDVSCCDMDIAGIAGVDEESSDDDYDGIGIAGCNMDGIVDLQAGKRKIPWKRCRKPVKARSLKSLM